MQNNLFYLNIDSATGGIDCLRFTADKHELNWVDGAKPHGVPYGKYSLRASSFIADDEYNVVYGYKGLELNVLRKLTDGGLINKYVFTNDSQTPLAFAHGDLGITMPFNDNYESANTCLTKKCHMHIWSAINVGYVACKRMNGENCNLGVLLTKGATQGYAINREWNSNDRGDLTMLLPAMTIEPKQSVVVEFISFMYDTFTDFYSKCLKSASFLNIQAPKYSLNVGESIDVLLNTISKGKIVADMGEVISNGEKNILRLQFAAVGEYKVNISYGDNLTTYAEFYVHNALMREVDERLRFIVDNQLVKTKGKLDGAIMLYDNLTNKPFVEDKVFNDRNFGRERMSMVTSMLERLIIAKSQGEDLAWLESAAARALAFVDRALVKDSGCVYDAPNFRRMPFRKRLYNYSWAMLLYSTAFEYYGDIKYLNKACAIARTYYAKGGAQFYAILLPFSRIYNNCLEHQYMSLAEEMKHLFMSHGDKLVEISLNYPAHEVKYEQSIVAPSVDILLECYKISDDRKYLDEAEKQLPLLEAFNGAQPSFHMNEVAIRHWDGYWFGKNKMYGDTFPHYWSCISAMVFSKYAVITGKDSYARKADVCLANNLSLIRGGVGSCAYVYPSFVNGQRGEFYDPWANDQDWAMWFNLKYNREMSKNVNVM